MSLLHGSEETSSKDSVVKVKSHKIQHEGKIMQNKGPKSRICREPRTLKE